MLLILAIVMGAVLLAAPADSATLRWRGIITFDKSWATPSNSRLTWQLSRRQGDAQWTVVETRSWRAGSGMLGKVGRNACARNIGWLPNGTYALRQYDDYAGNKIKGRAFRLDDMTCATGTRRVDLFIHSEQDAGNRQCRDQRGDQLCRWELARYNEYKSAGCIKLAPSDLAQLVALYHRHFHAGVRYPKAQVVLRVTD